MDDFNVGDMVAVKPLGLQQGRVVLVHEDGIHVRVATGFLAKPPIGKVNTGSLCSWRKDELIKINSMSVARRLAAQAKR